MKTTQLRLSALQIEALRLVRDGKPYHGTTRTKGGDRRSSRTQTLQSLLRRGLVATGPSVGEWTLTEAGGQRVPAP